VILIAPDYGRPIAGESGVWRVAGRPVPRDPEDRLMRRQAVRRLSAQLERFRPELLHVHTPFVAHYAGVELARSLAIPLVTTYHTYFEHYFEHYVPFIPRRWLAGLARRVTVSQCAAADIVISPSSAMRDALRAYGVRGRIEILPTGLAADIFKPGDGGRFRSAHGIDARRPVALHVGRAAHEKNIDFLLRMLVVLRGFVPDVLFVLAGEGPALLHLKQTVRTLRLEDCVRFVGYLNRRQELPDCYSAADVFVFSSRTETQGLVVLEAMAQGTPVVSNAEMGTRDVLIADHGAHIVPLDETVFADAVAELLTNRAKRAEMSPAAREHALAWSSRTMAQRLVALYQDLTQSRVALLRELPHKIPATHEI
jgi:glycosyltransferase involved in cell wall biosynthesis